MPEPTDPTRTSDPPKEPPTATDHTRSHDRDPATATADPADRGPAEPLEVLPGFDIIRELGSGGMGVVYEARQTRLNRLVALKVLRGGRGEAKDVIRFLAEAEAVAAIRHPNVVQVYETDQNAGRPYMVLELLTGGTLADRLAAGKLDPRDAAALVAKLADAVRAAHELGIVHRDLKPSNVLFSGSGVVRSRGGETNEATTPPPHDLTTPKITDFGLAKRAGGVDLTRTQAVMGTPAYMAPEQARGDTKFVGPAADVWALGAILYECLTGRRPFDAEETFAVLRKVIEEAPPRPRDHVPGLPRDLELIALKCLEKSPADRYPSAAALADDLERFLAGKPVSVRPAGRTERFAKWVRRNPGVAGAATAVALTLVVGTAVSLAFGLEARERGEELRQTNKDLSATLGDLRKSRDDLMKSRNDLDASMQDVKRAQGDSEERGYLSDVALAHQLWKANDLAGMRAALDRCPPARRKWEWQYLDGLSRPTRAAYPTDSMPLALAYSPDGKLLAHMTLSGVLVVHDLATGKERLRLPALGTKERPWQGGQPDGLNCALAFGPDSKELAAACGRAFGVLDVTPDPKGPKVELVEPKPGDLLPKNPPAPPDRPRYVALAYRKDGRLLGAVQKDADARGAGEQVSFVIRDVGAGKALATLAGPRVPKGVIVELGAAAFSADGTRFAASVVDSGIRVQSDGGQAGPGAVEGKQEPPKAKEKEPPKFERFDPELRVWDVATGELVGSLGSGGGRFGQIAFGPGNAALFGRLGETRAFDPAPETPNRSFPGHTGEVQAVAFDRNGLVWSGGEDKFIRAHAWATGKERYVLRGCANDVLRLAVSPDGSEVAAACGDLYGGGTIHRFDVWQPRADVWRVPVNLSRPSLVTALAPDGSRFAATHFSVDGERAGEGQLFIRSVSGDSERVIGDAGRGPWVRGALRPDGGLVVVERNSTLKLFGPDGKPAGEAGWPVERRPVNMPPVITISPDGRVLAAVSAAREFKVRSLRAQLDTWDAATLKPGLSASVDLSTAFSKGETDPAIFPTSAVFDPTGKRLAATFIAGWKTTEQVRLVMRGILIVWDAATGKEVFRQLRDEQFHAVAFDSKGRVFAGGGDASGGAVFGWDIGSGKEVLTLRGHTRAVLSLAFGQEGRLATGGEDRVVKLWDLESQREVLTLDGFAREVTHVAFTPNGRDLVAATGVNLMNTMVREGMPTEWPPAEVRVFRGPK